MGHEHSGTVPAEVMGGEDDPIGGSDGVHQRNLSVTDAAATGARRDGRPAPLVRVGRIDAVAEVRRANHAFYEAFEGRDLDAMSAVWEHTERVICTHPGWATLQGWGAVASSFFALFQTAQSLQFILTEERIHVHDGVAWVAVDENLLGDQGGSTVAAVNLFVRDGATGRWQLVCHHGSVVSDVATDSEGPPTPE